MNNYKETFDKFLKDNFDGTELKIAEIKEDENCVFGYARGSEDYDNPTLVLDKKTNEIKVEIVPPFTNDENAKTIWKEKEFKEFKKEGIE